MGKIDLMTKKQTRIIFNISVRSVTYTWVNFQEKRATNLMECAITLNNQSISRVRQFENSPLQGVHVERGLVAAQHDADEDPQIAHVLLRHHAPWQVHITFPPVFVFCLLTVVYFFPFSLFSCNTFYGVLFPQRPLP